MKRPRPNKGKKDVDKAKELRCGIDFFLECLSDDAKKGFTVEENASAAKLMDKSFEVFKLLLSNENIKKARELLSFVLHLFPDSQKFLNAQKIIAPPEIVKNSDAKTDGLNETVQALTNIDKKYHGKWVAVSKGKILGSSNSYKRLARAYTDQDVYITIVV